MSERGFGSDNGAGVHPEVLRALGEANQGHVPAYGADPYTERAVARFRALFGEGTHVHLVFGGTGANIVALAALAEPYHAVLCAETAHIQVDECCAPERFVGCKLLPVSTPDGKLTPDLLRPHLRGLGVPHHPQPRVVSISQPTEYGTLYSLDEVRALGAFAREHGLRLHMDGARIANAVASLDVHVRALTRDAGVDVLSFGGTKNGMMYGEAVLSWDDERAERLPFIRKQAMQLASKMRFVGAQFDALLADGLWLRNAAHANAMARRLAERVRDISGVAITQEPEVNAVFARLPAGAIPALQAHTFFYVWDEASSEVRWMTSFDTTENDVDGFAAAVREMAERGGGARPLDAGS